MKQRLQFGFAIISALFILVALAILGAFAVNVSGMQQTGSTQDVQGSRAYQAARAGLEWGLFQVNVANARSACSASPFMLTFPATAPTLSAFTVTVVCTPSVGPPAVFRIVATACNQPDEGVCPNTGALTNQLYIERRLEVFL